MLLLPKSQEQITRDGNLTFHASFHHLQVGHVFAFVLGQRFNVDILAQLFSPILAASVQHVELSVKTCRFQSQPE